MELREFGGTELRVSALGFGAGEIGEPSLDEGKVGELLNTALDLGVNLFDTARSYGLSEERIGRHISHRRGEFVLSTKLGYGIEGQRDWTYHCVLSGIDAALQRLKTDYLDIVHLHSCNKDTLQQGEVISALEDAKNQGKIRYCGYAGDNQAVEFALDSGRFQSLMTSINICDQRFLDRHLYKAKQKMIGIISKRPLANAPWRFAEEPIGHYGQEYWHRYQQMGLRFGLPMDEIALRFAAFSWGVDSCIVGTTNIDHLKTNVDILSRGRLPQSITDSIRNSFREHDMNWNQLI